MADTSTTMAGNVTRDPELRFTVGGTATCSFGIAVNRRYQSNGEWQEKVSFFNVVAWGQLAENVSASITKGSRVLVTGRMEQREYEDKKTGQKRTSVELVADEIGASLRWATVMIDRTERSGGSSSRQSANVDPVYGDEEPFVSIYRGHQSYRDIHMEPGF